jgi:hypothetical protein
MKRPRCAPDKVDLARAARLFNYYARVRETGDDLAVFIEAPTAGEAERFHQRVCGNGTVTDNLWWAVGFEPVQAIVAMLWPWLAQEVRDRARAVLGQRPPVTVGGP